MLDKPRDRKPKIGDFRIITNGDGFWVEEYCPTLFGFFPRWQTPSIYEVFKYQHLAEREVERRRRIHEPRVVEEVGDAKP